MKPQTFFDHFERLADAPNAVARLRELILQLAVQGKLVEQDERDEPAPRLLERIEAERRRLVREKKIKGMKPPPSISEDEKPFLLPSSWMWVRLGELCELENGDRSKNYPSRSEFVSDGIPFINAGHLRSGRVDFESMNFIPESRFNLLKSGKVRDGDILFCLRGSLGKTAVVHDITLGAIASSLVITRLIGDLDRAFALNYFISPLAALMIKRFDNGTAQPNLSSVDLGKFLFPLPPLEEQKRIVTKVDELMRLCDELEQAQGERREVRQRISRAALDGLLAAHDAAESQARWRVVLDHFPTLTAAPGQIAKLRQTVLQLAVQGRLVEQDERDEPAARLLERIEAERKRLVREKKIREAKPLPPVSDDEKPFEIPESWRWVRLRDIGITQTGTTPSKDDSECFGNDSPFIKPADILPNRVDYNNEGLSRKGVEKYGRLAPAGSVLMVCIGTIGKANVIERDCSFNQQINSITPLANSNSYLINYFLRSDYFQEAAWLRANRTTIAILNKGNWEDIPFPFPPLGEQSRIAAKVDELMRLCDELEAGLRRRDEEGERLLRGAMRALLASPNEEAATEAAASFAR